MHWSFLLLVGLVVVSGLPAGAWAVLAGIVWVVALFASVVVHELAHCLVARRRGGRVLGILLLPIGGMSRMSAIPAEPRDEAAVAIAGPATSLGLGVLLVAVAAAAGGAIWPPALLGGSWLARLGWLNLLLGVFNLLPALPMDGGRVLRAALARRLPKLRATTIAATVAKVIAAGLVVAGAFIDLWLVVIGVFVFIGASQEEAVARRDDQRWWNRGAGWGPPGPPPGWGPPPPGWGPPPAGWWPPPAQNEGDGERAVSVAPRRQASAIDVPVEGARADAGGSEPIRERVGQHD